MATRKCLTGKYKIDAKDLQYAIAFSQKYPKWLDQYNALKDAVKGINYDSMPGGKGIISDSTFSNAERRTALREKMLKVERCAYEAGGEISEYLFKSVIYDLPFEEVKAQGMPCERTFFYEKRRKYYYLLNQII